MLTKTKGSRTKTRTRTEPSRTRTRTESARTGTKNLTLKDKDLSSRIEIKTFNLANIYHATNK